MNNSEKDNNIIKGRFVSRPPLILYIVCVSVFVFFIYLLINGLNILMALFDCVIVVVLLYYFLLRGISKISFSRGQIIQQSFCSKKMRIIRFDRIESYQYYRSGYAFWSTDTKSRVVEKPYDELFLSHIYKGERKEEILKINIRYGEFMQMIALINDWYPYSKTNHEKELIDFL
ncbi:MAG: hypothetical protein PHU33_14500 [Bacteroidales bacterium]|nr:hypothetical protein [Bacteroidales bacterium]